MKKLWILAAAAFIALASGCATGPKYSESTIPTLSQDQGRIYFLRSSSMLGAAIQPDIRLNGQAVGQSKPGGFFFVDRPAGQYVASTSTETEKTLSFTLDAGETKYVRSSPSFGVLVGRVVLQLESPDKAKVELPSLSLTASADKK